MTQFRVGVVGLGEAGFTLHLPALAGMTSAAVVGGCDLDAARRARAAERWRIPVFDDFDTLLREGRPDVIIVGTPPDSHAAYCLRSLAAGAHVVCEKPFMASLSEADEVIAAARDAGRRVALNHEFREMPIFRAVREAIAREATDGVILAQIWQLMDMPPSSEGGWRGQLRERTLYEAGVHLVDFVMALFGERPLAVTATMSAAGQKGRVGAAADAIALVTFEFRGGRIAQTIQSRVSKGARHYFDVRADTAQASYRASFGGRARVSAGLLRSTTPHLRFEYGKSGFAWREVGSQRQFLARNPKDPGMLATREVLEQTFRAFSQGTPAPTDASQAREILEVIAACYRSAREGRRVTFDGADTAGVAGMRLGVAVSPA